MAKTKKLRTQYFIDEKLGFEAILSSGSEIAYPEHNHVSTYIVGLICQGSMTLKTGKTLRTLRPGDVYRVEPYEPHALWADGPYAMVTVCVTDRGESATEKPARLEAIGAKLRTLRKEWLSPDDSAKIAAELLRPRAYRTPAGLDRLDALKNMLVGHPEQSLNLDDMAAVVNLCPQHLVRMFKKRFGLTPHRFHKQNRVRLARRRCKGASSLTRLALDSGFYDQSHCIREFRKALGMTPRQYLAARRSFPSRSGLADEL